MIINLKDASIEIDNLAKQIVNMYSPEKVILFGSYSKNAAALKSDFDICIIIHTNDKRNLLTDMYLNIKS